MRNEVGLNLDNRRNVSYLWPQVARSTAELLPEARHLGLKDFVRVAPA